MEYNALMLIGLGLLGILLHCAVELNKLNRRKKGDYKMAIKEYFKLEIFSLFISLFVVIGVTAISSEVEELLIKLGYEWLIGFAYISAGYSSQSILIFAMGRAHGVMNPTNNIEENQQDGNQ